MYKSYVSECDVAAMVHTSRLDCTQTRTEGHIEELKSRDVT